MAATRKSTTKKTSMPKREYREESAEVTSSVKPMTSLLSRALPFVYIALLLFAFGFGILWQKVNNLQNALSQGSTNTATTTGTGTQQTAQATPPPVDLNTVKDLFNKGLITFGDANRKVLFVAVEDPSCPYCHIASGDDPELNKQSGAQFLLTSQGGTYVAPMKEMRKLVDNGSASMVYIYTPGHGNGEMGQKALYCAYEKGKFWQAHDLLYSNAGYNLQNSQVMNDKSKSGIVADFLKSVIPAADMKACLDSGKYDSRLTSDQTVASNLNVSGTPGFFVNTTRFPGAYSYTDMQSAVSQALGN
jgi:protein-disulfide isomerase